MICTLLILKCRKTLKENSMNFFILRYCKLYHQSKITQNHYLHIEFLLPNTYLLNVLNIYSSGIMKRFEASFRNKQNVYFPLQWSLFPDVVVSNQSYT